MLRRENLFAWIVLLSLCGSARAQEPNESGENRVYRFDVEAKAHYRDSEENRFRVGFPFTPEMLPVGQEFGFLETVDPGQHAEISAVTLFFTAEWSESLEAHVKVDLIDLHDRNPTSDDREWDVDEAWIRFGREAETAISPERGGAYLKIGKMPKFERQDDRHLESYGLVSTAFNRLEDLGIEIGADLGRHFYLRGSVTQGNPLFIRDPNALAGDNGIAELRTLNPDPELGSGIVILYDAEVEAFEGESNPELGAGIGWRTGDPSGHFGLDVMAWGYQRDLADTVELEGTFYGGDLDLLRGPLNAGFGLPITGDEKRELGINFWLYSGGFSLFAQGVDQEVAGMDRSGWELEAAWNFDLPVFAGVRGKQLFPWLAPAVRYSKLDPDFPGNPQFPAPSITWEWEKLDVGLRVAILDGLDLTVEWAANRFILASGAERDNDEFLTTLRWSS